MTQKRAILIRLHSVRLQSVGRLTPTRFNNVIDADLFMQKP